MVLWAFRGCCDDRRVFLSIWLIGGVGGRVIGGGGLMNDGDDGWWEESGI